jgi:hypothetical protein
MNLIEILILIAVAAVLYGIYWALHHKPQIDAAIDKGNAERDRLKAEATAILIKAKADAALALSQAETMYHNLVKDQKGTVVPPNATAAAIDATKTVVADAPQPVTDIQPGNN